MKSDANKAFTLVEMLVVIAMMAIIMSFGIVMFTGALKSSAIASASQQTYTALTLARQYAITQRAYFGVMISNYNAYAIVSNMASPQIVGRIEYLPTGATFTNIDVGVGAPLPVPTSDRVYVWFRPSGAALQDYRLNITDGQSVSNYSSISVNQVLGAIRTQKPQ